MRSSQPQSKEAGNRLYDKSVPCFFLRSTLEIPLPAFDADYFSVVLPFPQTIHRDSHFPCKGFLTQAEGFPIGPDAFALPIVKELIEFVQEVRHGDTIECRQTLYHLQRNMLSSSTFDINVDCSGHACNLRHFCLHQSTAVSAPPKPVRYILDLLISAIPLIELGRHQNLPWGAQYETMYE